MSQYTIFLSTEEDSELQIYLDNKIADGTLSAGATTTDAATHIVQAAIVAAVNLKHRQINRIKTTTQKIADINA